MSGHLFLVHGRVESLVHDAALVPTNDAFDIEPTWRPVLEMEDPARLRPPGWPREGSGRAADGRAIWFVSVGPGLSTDDLVARVVHTARRVAGADLQPARNRVKRLLAVPVLGIEGGGHDRNRGEVVRQLLESLVEVVAALDLDIAVITPERSVHAAAQHVRGQPAPAGFSPGLRAEAARLGGLARSGELALFFGAGVSVPAGLPAWREMLEALAARAEVSAEALAGLGPLDQAQLLQRRLPDLDDQIAEAAQRHHQPSLAHALLAGLRCREAVTTNYDRLYETAVAATDRGRPCVLPWEAAVGASAWVLKLHGDVTVPESVTFTRRDYVRFDARTRPAGALL
ncbi:MAG TPA: SIR2 family protein, partial [Marmoricola sp.]|nr:SIR2 family protein [Marmoricola sp.]